MPDQVPMNLRAIEHSHSNSKINMETLVQKLQQSRLSIQKNL